ncbi:MAG: hypothetical protein FD128_1785 [Hyphomonadaceae bacterium]|nr:MAG: hypothetical protein FD128_1785 [Hyphomonadaceae bacterium]
MKKYLKYGLAVVALGFIAAPAFSQYVRNPALVRPIPQSTAKLLSTARFTRFDPAVHGFRFLNYFSNVTGVFDITTGGLCGGMVYTMLDYFKTGRALPQQDYTPVSGTALERHIYARQMNSLGDHMDKWVELHGNPFGARNSEFFDCKNCARKLMLANRCHWASNRFQQIQVAIMLFWPMDMIWGVIAVIWVQTKKI